MHNEFSTYQDKTEVDLFYHSLSCELSFKGKNNVNQYILLFSHMELNDFLNGVGVVLRAVTDQACSRACLVGPENPRGGTGFSLGLASPYPNISPGDPGCSDMLTNLCSEPRGISLRTSQFFIHPGISARISKTLLFRQAEEWRD